MNPNRKYGDSRSSFLFFGINYIIYDDFLAKDFDFEGSCKIYLDYVEKVNKYWDEGINFDPGNMVFNTATQQTRVLCVFDTEDTQKQAFVKENLQHLKDFSLLTISGIDSHLQKVVAKPEYQTQVDKIKEMTKGIYLLLNSKTQFDPKDLIPKASDLLQEVSKLVQYDYIKEYHEPKQIKDLGN